MSDVMTIHIDGAARGNPGPAAFAYVIARDGHPLVEEAGCLGNTTNNVAEYTALVKALERAAALGGRRLRIQSDSELLVKQMNGEYRVKHPHLQELHFQARKLLDPFDSVTLVHVRREANSHADRLCNEVLDGVPSRKTAVAPASPVRDVAVRQEVLECLRAAAEAWSLGDPRQPPVEAVWEQIWSILEEHKVLRPARRRSS